jgi:hypothetical protein
VCKECLLLLLPPLPSPSKKLAFNHPAFSKVTRPTTSIIIIIIIIIVIIII